MNSRRSTRIQASPLRSRTRKRKIGVYDKRWNNYWQDRLDNTSIRRDNRSSAQRDYARVIHSSAFRRLQAKTQVLGLGDSDFYRTRLTHSLEVCQIGEGITRSLHRRYHSRKEFREILPRSEQIRAICLAHDLGHPPFGHGGEQVLNKIMKDDGGFEGNGQSLRIMTHLPSYHNRYGMNLSRRTLLGVIKYPATYSEICNADAYPNGDKSKFPASEFRPPKCYYDEEKCVVDWITQDLEDDWEIVKTVFNEEPKKHGETKYMSLDARILEIADDIAYGVHDLEDAISLKFIRRPILAGGKVGNALRQCLGYNSSEYGKFLNLLFSNHSFKQKEAIGYLVGLCVRSVKLKKIESLDLIHPIFYVQAKLNRECTELLDILNKVVRENVINTARVQQLEYRGKMIVEKLFDAFDADPSNLLPEDQRKRYYKRKCSSYRKRVICDYVSGMTDDYAIRRYQQMFIPDLGSVFDHLG